MIEPKNTRWYIWSVGIVSLLWNSMGALDYTMTHLRNPAWMKNLTPEMIAWLDSVPLWATSSWAIGVWGAVAGSILLLVRSRLAVTAFGLSLLGLIGTRIYQYGSALYSNGVPASDLVFTATLVIVAVALLWYAVRLRKQGLLR